MSCVDESVGKTVEMSSPEEQASETASKQGRTFFEPERSTPRWQDGATRFLAFCFSLCISLPSARIARTARSESTDSYVFTQQESSVRFTSLGTNQVRVDANDQGDWVDCDPLGRIDRCLGLICSRRMPNEFTARVGIEI
jgi:hypothetical protein